MPSFFEQPILNSPYEHPRRHWELDDGRPTHQIVEHRREASFITPIPKPKGQRRGQRQLALDQAAAEVDTASQQYQHAHIINGVRRKVAAWRELPERQWKVTPETARLLRHWRHHAFAGIRPFFCQVEAAETAIWLMEVAPKLGRQSRSFLDHLQNANEQANPGLSRLALKLATGAGKTTVMAMLIACAFNYDAGASEFTKLGALSVLKARMNADLHMAEDLKNTGKGNLFVAFGEPDIDVEEADGQLRVRVRGVDVYHPASGDIRSDNADGIACWFVDTDYNGESFFVRHAYFLGANATDPYKSLKTTFKAEIDADAWNTLYSEVSRPFEKPASGRIAVKVINHLGDEVMKVVRV